MKFLKGVNKVILIGNLTKDPVFKNTTNGSGVTTFTIATNRSWKTESGEQREEVDYHRIVCWRKLAELSYQYLHKGDPVYVEGRISYRKYTDEQGVDKYITEINTSELNFLPSGNSSESSSNSKPKPPTQTPPKPSVSQPTDDFSDLDDLWG